MGALYISVYAPTNVRDEGDKDRFYQELESVVKACPAGKTPLMLADFNALIGLSRAGYESVVVPHGRDARTNNGSELLDFPEVIPSG